MKNIQEKLQAVQVAMMLTGDRDVDEAARLREEFDRLVEEGIRTGELLSPRGMGRVRCTFGW